MGDRVSGRLIMEKGGGESLVVGGVVGGGFEVVFECCVGSGFEVWVRVVVEYGCVGSI